jgi:hypothetical protein
MLQKNKPLSAAAFLMDLMRFAIFAQSVFLKQWCKVRDLNPWASKSVRCSPVLMTVLMISAGEEI